MEVTGRKARNNREQVTNMSESIENHENAAQKWEAPIFQEIPISFESSAYALADEDSLHA